MYTGSRFISEPFLVQIDRLFRYKFILAKKFKIFFVIIHMSLILKKLLIFIIHAVKDFKKPGM